MEPRRIARMTSQRRVMLEVLRECPGHPTADEVYEKVRQRLPRVSLGTVYRNLELLAAHGVIRKIEFSGSQKRFDAETAEHWHVHCLSCGSIEDVGEQEVPGLKEAVDALGQVGGGEHGREALVPDAAGSQQAVGVGRVERTSSFQIIGHRIEFVGTCPRCRGVDGGVPRGFGARGRLDRSLEGE